MSDTMSWHLWEFIFLNMSGYFFYKQDRFCLLKLDITSQVYESMELLFWNCGDVSTCVVDWWLCGWSIIQMVWDEFIQVVVAWRIRRGKLVVMTSNISKSDRRSEFWALRRKFLRCSCCCVCLWYDLEAWSATDGWSQCVPLLELYLVYYGWYLQNHSIRWSHVINSVKMCDWDWWLENVGTSSQVVCLFNQGCFAHKEVQDQATGPS